MASNMSHITIGSPQKRRGRKRGVKTVSEAVEHHRRLWLSKLTQEKGKNAELCHLLKVPDSFVSHLTAGRRTFTDAITSKLESVLGLQPGTVDKGLTVSNESQAATSVAPVGVTSSSVTLDPGLASALQNLLSQALVQGKIGNVTAVRLINELVSLSA